MMTNGTNRTPSRQAVNTVAHTHTHTHNGGEECAGDFTISTGDGICHSLAVYHNDGDRPMQDDQVDTLPRGEPSPEHLSAPWRRCSWGDWGPGPAAGWRPPAPAPAASAPAASPPAGRAIIPRDQSLIRTKCLQGRLKKNLALAQTCRSVAPPKAQATDLLLGPLAVEVRHGGDGRRRLRKARKCRRRRRAAPRVVPQPPGGHLLLVLFPRLRCWMIHGPPGAWGM